MKFLGFGKKATSIPEKLEAIYTVFYNSYSNGLVSEIFDEYIIVKLDWSDKTFYKIPYTFDDDKGEATLAPVQNWVQGEFAFQETKAMGFKILDDGKWLAIWSNSFIDKEGEIFSHKAHLDYIDWVNARNDYSDGDTHMPELWMFHVPGTKIGKAIFVEDHGLFQIAVGKFDDTEIADVAKNALADLDISVSHGFYPVSKQDGVYKKYRTFEISTLLRGWEANEHTGFLNIGDNNMDEKVLAKLTELLGDDLVGEITTKLDETEAGLKAAGVAFKSEDDKAEVEVTNVDEAFAQILERLAAQDVRIDNIESKMFTPANALMFGGAGVGQKDLVPVDISTDDKSFVDEIFADMVKGVE